jgi:hypothetical protein
MDTARNTSFQKSARTLHARRRDMTAPLHQFIVLSDIFLFSGESHDYSGKSLVWIPGSFFEFSIHPISEGIYGFRAYIVEINPAMLLTDIVF